ncbi:hypothetical protein FXF51_25875 [Nonomuraea sp. PA05]|uniref:hypothetical protein n=1 Tax=Nonomuraea sp. PA05 TaxID=2604466 RepID=UPI0011D80AA8|nr:hypothetical protein [Nonomuraea sp. PA05]TYB62156.1 hypothetical protein FXF51_25875 [Nonomuraea sp. PA05]
MTLRDGMHAFRHRHTTAQVPEITAASALSSLLPGIGTLADPRLAHPLGVRPVRVATHCTEARDG